MSEVIASNNRRLFDKAAIELLIHRHKSNATVCARLKTLRNFLVYLDACR